TLDDATRQNDARLTQRFASAYRDDDTDVPIRKPLCRYHALTTVVAAQIWDHARDHVRHDSMDVNDQSRAIRNGSNLPCYHRLPYRLCGAALFPAEAEGAKLVSILDRVESEMERVAGRSYHGALDARRHHQMAGVGWRRRWNQSHHPVDAVELIGVAQIRGG